MIVHLVIIEERNILVDLKVTLEVNIYEHLGNNRKSRAFFLSCIYFHSCLPKDLLCNGCQRQCLPPGGPSLCLLCRPPGAPWLLSVITIWPFAVAPRSFQVSQSGAVNLPPTATFCISLSQNNWEENYVHVISVGESANNSGICAVGHRNPLLLGLAPYSINLGQLSGPLWDGLGCGFKCRLWNFAGFAYSLNTFIKCLLRSWVVMMN